MPAVGILKKPPHPDPPATLDRVKPPRPPKPKRGLPPPPPPRIVAETRTKDIHPADEDEPTTEESYDYKDIDLAAEIFDWRIPPPRPKPPRLQANGVAHRVADSVPVVVGETPAVGVSEASTVAYDTSPSAVEQRLEPVVEDEGNKADDEAGETRVKADKLAIFLAEHEGKELTMEDVRQLELLLDEAEGVEREQDQDHISDAVGDANNDEGVKEDVASQENEGEIERYDDDSSAVVQVCNGEGPRHNGEPQSTGKVRFSDESVQDIGSIELFDEVPDEDPEGGRPMRHADYGIMQFFHAGGKKGKKASKAKDSGMYEPVGRQDLRFVRPDMSGYRPPEPSDVGDPFSWRRRDKRRLYGYEPVDRSEEPTPAMDKILDGCQEVEDMIKARDLTPPGMLFDSLGRKKRVRKVRPSSPPLRPPSPPPRPPPPVPPKLRTPSPLPPIPSQPEEPNDDVPMDLERQLELEKQILTDLSFVEALEGSVSVKEEVLVAGSLGDGGTDPAAVPNGSAEAVVEDIIVPMDAYLTGDVSLPSDVGATDVPQTDIPQTDVPETESEGRMVAPRRVSRRDSGRRRPPRPAPPCVLARPIPPERRKRVASAEPPLTAFEREQVALERAAPPRSKAKRSVSFHTAEEIRKRIDIQAQNYLRTPRRKDRLSCVYLATSPSASAALNYGSLRRDHRRPLTPVYSHVNKEIPRRRETGVQTNGGAATDEDADALPPAPPPKMRDVEMMSPALEPSESPPSLEAGELRPTLEPGEPVMEDSEVPDTFAAPEQAPQADKSPEADRNPDADKSPDVAEDSTVPQDFLALSKPKDQGEKATEEDSAKPTSGSGRPLPPPPAPPRHRGVKAVKPLAFDGPVVICGIVPKGEEGKMTVLPDLKVLRLSVVQLDASMIRVGQIEAEHLVARRMDVPDADRTPTPSSQRPPDPDARMLPEADDDRDPVGGPPGNGNNNNNDEGFQTQTAPDQKKGPEDLAQRLQTPQPGYIRVASPVEGFNVWDGEYSEDRAECASPTNTMTSTTSGSASYVTCDETLHEGSDVTADGLDAGAADDDFGFGLDEDDDLDGRGTGCSTPTEMEATIGSDIPLALLEPGLLPIFAPQVEPYLPMPMPMPMDTDTDENFNSFEGDDSRDPSNTVGI